MDSLISVTQARNNFSQLINDVVREGKKFILLRKSEPQVVIMPYQEVLKKEVNWQEEFKQLTLNSKPQFSRWLKDKGIKEKDLTEEKLYEILDQAAGRN